MLWETVFGKFVTPPQMRGSCPLITDSLWDVISCVSVNTCCSGKACRQRGRQKRWKLGKREMKESSGKGRSKQFFHTVRWTLECGSQIKADCRREEQRQAGCHRCSSKCCVGCRSLGMFSLRAANSYSAAVPVRLRHTNMFLLVCSAGPPAKSGLKDAGNNSCRGKCGNKTPYLVKCEVQEGSVFYFLLFNCFLTLFLLRFCWNFLCLLRVINWVKWKREP